MANFTEKLQFTSSGPVYPIRANAIAFATCSTPAGTAEKAVSARNFELDTGANIVVYFTNTNTASNPTLNVNGTGAKAIYYRNAAVAAGTLAAGRTYQFTYDGNQYELIGDVNTDHLAEQVLSTANSNLPILLAYDTSTSTVTNSLKKASAFTYNPSTQILATPKLTVSTTTTLNGSTTIDNANVGDLLVNGGANFIQIPTAPTPAAGTNDTSIATTAFVYNAFQANDAMVFKGVVNSDSDLPGVHYQGWVYKVGTPGTYLGVDCEVGDTIYCVTDGDTYKVSDWVILQNNIDTFPWTRISGKPSTYTPSAHKSTDSATYGIATKTEYSHVKLIDGDVSSKTYVDGEAAAAAHTHGNYLIGHRAIQVNNVEMLSSASNTALSLVAGSGISLTSSASGVVTVTLDNHSSTGTTYGVAATDTYGHVKLVSGQIANNRPYANGEAAAAAHTHEATLPMAHASATTAYGLGTTSLYGHVKLYNGDLKSYSASTAYADGCAAAHQHFHSQYSLIGHDHGTIPLISGGTGISEISGNDWYTSNILHPHFEVHMGFGFDCYYYGPLTGISNVSDALSSDYFKMAVRETVPVYADNVLMFTGTIMTNATANHPEIIYVLFPDAVTFNGSVVNGIRGTLTYEDGEGLYLSNIVVNSPYYNTTGLPAILGFSSIGSSTTPVYYDGSDLVVTDLSSTYMGINQEFTVNVGSGLTGGGKLSSANTVIVLGHSNSVTAKTAAAQSAKTLSWSDTFTIYEEKYDAQGHITGVASYNMTMPSNPNTDSSVLQNAAITTNKQYPILLGYDDRTTVYTGAVNKAAGFTYNPSTQILTAPKLSVSTIASLNGSTTIDDATIGNLIVNGSVQLNSLAQGQTPASTSNDTTLATTAFVKTATAAITSVAQATSANYATTAGAFSSVASVSLTGDVSGSASSVKGWAITTTIGDSKVTSAKIADNAVVTAKINNGAVTSAKLGDSSVVTAKINDSAVTSAKLANSGVIANTYGNTSQQTPTSGNTFNIPYFTVSAKGIVTSAGVTTVKLPNSIASATTATSASYATTAGSAASATVATSANSVAWANVSGHAAGVKSDLGIESSGSTYLKKDGTWDTPTDTNDAVTQTATTTDASYEVLFSGTADNITRTEGAGKNSNLTFNPSTHVLTVIGNLYVKNPGGTSDWTNPEKLVLVGASNKEFSFKVNNNGNNVDVGWDWDTGAGSGLGLRGSDYSSPGQFFLYARNSTTGYAGLAGDANGVLKWNNRRVVTATDATQIGSASQPVYINSAGNATAGNTIPTITLNGSATTAASLYAPTSAGTSGQLLKSSGSGAPTWATITASDVGAATADHSHTLSIASTTETANIVLSAGGFYKLTAGDQTYNFQLPADNDTKNTAGATEVAANTTMWIVGATGQTANPQTYTKTGAKIDADGGLLGKTITVDTHVTLTYDSTTQSLKFVFS